MTSATYGRGGGSDTPAEQPDEADRPGAAAALSAGTLVAACLAVCLAEITIAMPTALNGLFQREFTATGSQIAWITDASLLPVTVLALTFGAVGDLFGRKRLLVSGALLLAVGHLVTASADGVGVLCTGRAIAGVGAAALFPTSLAMIASGTHTGRQRARGITVWASALAGGAALAPVISGLSAEHGSWRSAFAVVAVLSAVSAAVSLLCARDSRAPSGRSLDWGGQVTIAIGLFALLYAVIQAPTDGWAAPTVVIAFAVAVVFGVLFVFAERRSRSPLLRLDLFRNRAFSVSACVTVVGMFSFVATAYSTSIRLAAVQHHSPLITAGAFVLLNGVTLVVAPVTSLLVERVNPRWMLAGGLLLTGTGGIWAAQVPIGDTSFGALAGPLLLVGLGFAFTVTSISAVAVNAVPVRLAGMASGATSMLRDLGFTLGPAIISAVALGRASTEFRRNLLASPLPGAVKDAATEVARRAGPLAVNSLPPTSLPGAAAPLATQALGTGYSLAYLVNGIAALAACVLTASILRGENGRRP